MVHWFLLPFYFIDEYLLILRYRLAYILSSQPPAAWSQGKRGDVLLIPGLHERWPFLSHLAQAFADKGLRLHIVKDLKNNTCPLATGCRRVEAYILKHQLKDLIVLTHSKGGLVACLLLTHPKIAWRIKRVVTLACPYRGTFTVAPLHSAHELLPISPVINQLYIPHKHKILNLYPLYDNFIFPQFSLILTGAKNIQLPIFGHTRVLESPLTLRALTANL